MKNKILIILFICVFSLTGCGKKTKLTCTGPGMLSTMCYQSSDGETGCNIVSDSTIEWNFSDNGKLSSVIVTETSREGIIFEGSTEDGFGVTKKEATVDDWYKEYQDMCNEVLKGDCKVSKNGNKAIITFTISGEDFLNEMSDSKEFSIDDVEDYLNQSKYPEMKYICK